MLSAIMHTHFSCDPVRLLRIAYSSRTARLSLLADSLWISTLSVTTAAWCKLRSQSRFVFCAAQTNFLIICPPLTHTFTSVWWQCVYAFGDSEFCVHAGPGQVPHADVFNCVRSQSAMTSTRSHCAKRTRAALPTHATMLCHMSRWSERSGHNWLCPDQRNGLSHSVICGKCPIK